MTDRALPVGHWGRSDLTDAMIAAVDGSYGYRPLSVGLDRVSFARSFRPRWAMVSAILTAPTLVGLLFLLVRTTESFTCVVREDHSGISVRVLGRISPALLSDLDALCSRGGEASGSAPAKATSPNGPLSLQGAIAASPIAPPPFGGVAPPGGRPPFTPPNPSVHGSHGGPVGPSVPSWGAREPAAPSDGRVGRSVPNDVTQIVRSASGLPARPERGSLLALRFEDGRRVEVSGFALIGRNPTASNSDPEASLIVIDDETVSKTHLAVAVSGGEAWVADRHSTNGSAVVDLTGAESRLVPGERVRVEQGSAVRIGTLWAQVERLA